MLTRLFLVRHGEVAPEWSGRIYGCMDVPLSATGEEQARRAAQRLRDVELDAVVHSGLARATFGAARLAEGRACATHVDSDLREIDRGAWAGLSREEIDAREPGALSAWFGAPAATRPPGGESLEDLAQRVRPRLDAWAAAHPGGGVACVAHLWVLRIAVGEALRLPLDGAPRLAVATGGMVVVDWPVERSDAAERLRPTLVGFGLDRVPTGRAWFRGPHRDSTRTT